MPSLVAPFMSDLYGLKLEPMPNRLVNYGVTENGIAVIELTSDSAGAPLEAPNDRSPNTYTHGTYCINKTETRTNILEIVTPTRTPQIRSRKDFTNAKCPLRLLKIMSTQ